MPTLDEYMALLQGDPSQMKQQRLSALLGGLGAGLLSAPGWNRGLANGGLLASQGVASVQPQANDNAMQAMKTRQFAQQMADSDTAREEAQQTKDVLRNFQMPSPLPSMAPTNANAAALPPKAGTYERLMAQADALEQKGLVQQAMKYREMAEKYAPQYDGTETLMQDGKPVVMQRFKNRAPEAMGSYQPKPDFKQVDTGGQVGFYDPLTGQSGGQFGKTMTPDAMAGNEVARGNLDVNRARLNFDRAKDSRDQTTGAKPQWDSASGMFVFPPSEQAPQGKAVQPQGYSGKGGASALASQKALAAVEEAKGLLDNATGSYIGAGYDKTMQAFGSAPEGAQNIAKLKVLESNIMMNQPRMEGPQSNMDVLMYRQAAGQIGDPTVPSEMKRAALETIETMHRKYAAQPAKPGASGKWSITPVK